MKDVLVISLSFLCFGVFFIVVCIRFGYWCGILLWFAYGVRSFSICVSFEIVLPGFFSICCREDRLFLAFWFIRDIC